MTGIKIPSLFYTTVNLMFALYHCCIETGVFLMDIVPFRQFLRSKVYASKEELSDTIGRDEGDAFCKWVLDLRDDWRSSRCVGDYIQERDRCKLDFLPGLWCRVIERELFNTRSPYIKGVVPKPRGQQLSCLPVVYSVDVCLTWVGVPFPHLPSLFKHIMFVQIFVSCYKGYNQLCGLTIFIDETSCLYPIVRTSLLMVHQVLSYAWTGGGPREAVCLNSRPPPPFHPPPKVTNA